MSDLISRRAAIDAVWDISKIVPTLAIRAKDALETIPSAQQERKVGKWIMGKCDQCGAHAPFWPMATTYYESDFCPNCGARMEE